MALSDFFNNATVSTRPDAGALTAQKLIAAASITVDTTAGWPVSPDSVHFIIYQVDAGGNKVAGTQTDWKGTVTSSTAIGSLTLKAGTDQIYPVGSKVIATPTGAWADDLITGLLNVLDQDATLKAGAVDVTAVIADGIVTRAKLATAVTTELNDGWTTPTQTVSSVTNNGNKSYDVVFNSTVASVLSPGMRLRTTRTVTAPTQCADLESGSTQYFNDTSVSGITFTDDFCAGGWVKLESYTNEILISRYNGTSGWYLNVTATGQVVLNGINAGSGNFSLIQSYQSLPLGKWVYISAQLDMSAFTATTTTSYIMIDGVDVPAFVQRGGTNPTALVQAGNLEIGSFNGGTLTFDGKIAQVWVSSAKITQANVKLMMSQGLTTADTATYSLASAYSLNGVITDLNTTSANNLTAQGGALATATDSPFGQDSNGVTAGTTDYALVMKVNGATATVQVPEGCTIPTSGGVSAVAYSTATSPFGFTLDKFRWRVGYLGRLQYLQAPPVSGTWYNLTSTSAVSGGLVFTVPVGAWSGGYDCLVYGSRASGANDNYVTLSTANNTESDRSWTSNSQASATTDVAGECYKQRPITLSSATALYLNAKTANAGLNSLYILGDRANLEMFFEPAGI